MVSKYLLVFVLGLAPVIEPRYAIGYAMHQDLSWVVSLLICLLAGIVLATLLTELFYRFVEKVRFGWFQRLYRWWIDRVRSKHDKRLERFGMLGLIAFVAIPIPLTGVYTGITLAYLAGLPKKYTWFGAVVGMFISVVIVLFTWESIDLSSKFLLQNL